MPVIGNWKLLWAMIRNARARRLNRDMIGYTLENAVVPSTQEDFRAFARATRDVHYLQRTDTHSAPPLYLTKLMVPMLMTICTHKKLHMNLLRMVHASQEIHWHAPMLVGTRMRLRMSIADVCDTPVGEKMTIAGQVFSDGILVAEGHTGLIIRSRTAASTPPQPVKNGLPESFRASINTDEDQPRQYTAESGDRNFIHTQPVLAKLAGLPRTIMHGTCMLAMYCSALAHHAVDDDIHRLAGIEGRFGRPVFPGQTYTLVGYQPEKPRTIPFEVYDSHQASVFRNGRLTVR